MSGSKLVSNPPAIICHQSPWASAGDSSIFLAKMVLAKAKTRCPSAVMVIYFVIAGHPSSIKDSYPSGNRLPCNKKKARGWLGFKIRHKVAFTPVLSGQPAAVHGNSITINIVGSGRCQENRRPLQISRQAPAPSRYPFQDFFTAIFIGTQLLGIVGRHIAWRDGVNIDVMLCPFVSQQAGYTHDRTFGCRV